MNNSDKEDLIKWYHARRTFFGLDTYDHYHDFRKGLSLARDCSHPEARWLCGIFEKECPTDPHLITVILEDHLKTITDNDERAKCFYYLGMVYDMFDSEMAGSVLEIAAGLGNLASRINIMFWNGREGRDDENDLNGIKELAIQSNDPEIITMVIDLLDDHDLCEIAMDLGSRTAVDQYYRHHNIIDYLDAIEEVTCSEYIPFRVFEHLDRADFGIGNMKSFMMGKALKGRQNPHLYNSGPTREANVIMVIEIYDHYCNIVREVMRLFCLFVRRNYGNVIGRDIRTVICRMLWNDRKVWVERDIATKPKKRRNRKCN